MPNRLAAESSPYLLQHKDNPVDWYPWGDDAFERARAEDKPVLLSVGYAACHWCHVMEHESFEDRSTAAIMNESFVPVKVDREERPDVDSVYMDAVQAMTGQGGWPMTVFLAPDGAPFYAGTYFPSEDRAGLPSFKRVLVAIADAWRERRSELNDQGTRLVEHIRQATAVAPSDGAPGEDVLGGAADMLARSFDAALGGFGSAPKFPQPMVLDLLMRLGDRGRADAARMATTTLDAMASGGIFDQIGGGFHRYSVDRSWVVPHFEKMLYDNAQLVRTYSRSWHRTRSARHREVAELTVSWLLGEMRDPGGGFWSSLDADSEGEEGRFYLWSLGEVTNVLGADAEVARSHFGLSESGNFEGRNIPVWIEDGTNPDEVARVRSGLAHRRSGRVHPATDTKVLAGWNALAASCLAEAGSLLQHPDWVEAAIETMRFILHSMRVEGRLMRSFRWVNDRPVVRALGCCEDYAFVLEACLTLYESTFDGAWLRDARWAADEAIRLFGDEDGGFFTTGADASELVVRPKDVFDNAVPSGNSVLALELQRLSHLVGDPGYEVAAVEALGAVGRLGRQAPTGFGHALAAVDFLTGKPREIVVIGDPEGDDTRALVAAARSHPSLNKVLLAGPEGSGMGLDLLEGRTKVEGRAAAYVCVSGACRRPVTSSSELEMQLRGAPVG